MTKIAQTIFQTMRLKVPVDSPIFIGKSKTYFSNKPVQFLKITGKPARLTDDGTLLPPDIELITLHNGLYSIIESECEDDSDQAEYKARESNEIAAAWLALFFGKRATEKYIGINILPKPGQYTLVSDTERTPLYYPEKEIQSNKLEELKSFIKIFSTHDEEDRERTELALRWYMKGRQEGFATDGFLSFWISLEVLFGEWKDMDKLICKELSCIIPGKREADAIKEKLEIGHLLGLRADIVHKGKTTLGNAPGHEKLILLREIVEEILCHRIGIPIRNRLSTRFS